MTYKTQIQDETILGVKTFNDGVKLDDAVGQETLTYYKTLDHTTTFTTNGTSAGTSSAQTIRLVRVGRLVTMQFWDIPGFAAGSGTVGYILANNPIPDTGFRPTGAAAAGFCCIANSGAWVVSTLGAMSVGTDGSIKIFRDVVGTAFTSGATVGASSAFISWLV